MLWKVHQRNQAEVQGPKILCCPARCAVADLCLWLVLTWRWKVEKWMSGMKRTGWVSKSVNILKMVTSLRFWRMGTLTSTTRRKRPKREQFNKKYILRVLTSVLIPSYGHLREAKQAVNPTVIYYHLINFNGKNVSKQLLIYATSKHRATLSIF